MAFFLATGSPRQNPVVDTPTEEGVVILPENNWDVYEEVLVARETVVEETVIT